jgi:hypothetical protein
MNTNEQQQGRIYRTDDYSIFKTHENNRPLHEDQQLYISLKTHGFRCSDPIHCRQAEDGRLKVVRGHHRLHYAKMLKIPVYYIIDNADLDIYQFEGNTKVRWTISDFVFSRARNGDDSYKKLLDYYQKHRIPIGAAVQLLAGNAVRGGEGSSGKLQEVKMGNFKIGDRGHADSVMAILDLLDKFALDFSRSKSFIGAVSHILKIPNINKERFYNKMQNFGSFLTKQASMIDYLDKLESLYNRGSASAGRLPIKMLAIRPSRDQK